MKTCTRCKIEKPVGDYFKNKSACKACIKAYRLTRREQDREVHRIWSAKNKDKIKAYEAKRTKSGKTNAYLKKKRQDPFFRAKENTRNRIYKFLKGTKSQKTEQLLGISYDGYKEYLESQFTPSMTWENYGTYWEIDHIIPLSKGGSFHHTNTQPLSVYENRVKSNNI